MGWFLDFMQVSPGSPWMWLIRADKRVVQAWRIPAYGLFALLFIRDLLLARRRRLSDAR
jgi:predicted small integral membrane protein